MLDHDDVRFCFLRAEGKDKCRRVIKGRNRKYSVSYHYFIMPLFRYLLLITYYSFVDYPSLCKHCHPAYNYSGTHYVYLIVVLMQRTADGSWIMDGWMDGWMSYMF